MGVIRKKTATRGSEGGVKYICDVCSADITSTVPFPPHLPPSPSLTQPQVRIRCAHSTCPDYDLCVQCFASGESSHNHNPPTHPFRVIEQNSVPIYDKNWGADEELLLLEGAETYGLGSWADIADHIGGYRTKDEVREHYEKIYLKSSLFPLPERASPKNTELLDLMPREEFQARKKRRIETRKEEAKNAPPPTPKQKPTASVPSCHEVQGYMPGRLEFETEYANEAEEAVQHMQFDPGEGVNPHTNTLEPEMELKLTVMDIYNSRLTQRTERKKVIFEHSLLEYRKNAALDKKRTKEEKDLLNKCKPYARMMSTTDFESFAKGIAEEHNLRLAVAQLQDWRTMKIGDLKSGERYEQDKVIRAQKAVPMGSLDRERFASSQRNARPPPVVETPQGAAALVAPELPLRAKPNSPAVVIKPKLPPVPAIDKLPPMHFPPQTSDLHLLLPEEIDLLEKIHVHPKAYLVIKEAVLKEALKGNGTLKKRDAKALFGVGEGAEAEGAKGRYRLEPQKVGRVWEFMVGMGWIGRVVS